MVLVLLKPPMEVPLSYIFRDGATVPVVSSCRCVSSVACFERDYTLSRESKASGGSLACGSVRRHREQSVERDEYCVSS